jgi:hypothetical protein
MPSINISDLGTRFQYNVLARDMLSTDNATTIYKKFYATYYEGNLSPSTNKNSTNQSTAKTQLNTLISRLNTFKNQANAV